VAISWKEKKRVNAERGRKVWRGGKASTGKGKEGPGRHEEGTDEFKKG